MDTFNIIINARLKDNPVAQFLNDLGTNVKYISLRHGEFVLSPKIGVKYMTRESYSQAIKNRTIYRDIIEMNREYGEPILIIEGEETAMDPSLGLTALQGAEIFISVMNRIPIIFTKNDIESAQLIFMLSAQVGSGFDSNLASGNGDASEKHDSESGEKAQGDPAERIAAMIPDVNPRLAEALVKHFGSLANLFSADIEALKQVDGIGPKKAKKIYSFVRDTVAA